MNQNEYQMIEVLKQLQGEYGVFEIKAEFEAEGSRLEELMRLKDVTSRIGLKLLLKIGGGEAITDIYNGLALGVNAINAPMAETPFALSKYLNSVKNFIAEDNRADIEFSFNLETITAFQNLDAMLALPNIDVLQSMTIGRVDLSGSMNLDRRHVNGDEIFKLCHGAFSKARAKKLKCALGGAISADSIEFINKMNQDQLIDKYETRKVVFPAEAVKHGEKAFFKAVEFELMWLKSKRRYYSGITKEDESRIAMLEQRTGK